MYTLTSKERGASIREPAGLALATASLVGIIGGFASWEILTEVDELSKASTANRIYLRKTGCPRHHFHEPPRNSCYS